MDDEPSILRSTAILLEDLGCEAVVCDDASRIRDMLEAERPDLLLQDVRMPGLDIERLVLGLRSDPRFCRLPIVVFSASMDAEEVAARVKAVGVLAKPFRPEALARLVTLAGGPPVAAAVT